MQSSASSSENQTTLSRRSSRKTRTNPIIMNPPKSHDNDDEEIDLFSPLVDTKQATSKLEELESRNTTSPEENLKETEFQENKSFQEEGSIDREKAIREIEELFASEDETSHKNSTSPKKAETCLELEENKANADPDEEDLKSNLAQNQKKRGRKKSGSNKNSDAGTISVYDLDQSGKYKLTNKLLTKTQLKERYQDIIYEFQSIEEVACVVCLDEDDFSGDVIIFCDLCNSAFHQSCYGSDLLTISPEDNDQWFCQRCEYLYQNDLPSTTVICMFCPEMKGAIKQISNNNFEIWGHVTCVNWIPEIYYEKDEEKEDATIKVYENRNHFGRTSLNCTVCKIKYGDPIQCDKEKCTTSFHVTCAQRTGLICNWKNMKQRQKQSDTDFYLPVYCKRHMKEFDKDMLDFSNKIEQENQLKDSRTSYLISSEKVEKKPIIPKKKKKEEPNRAKTTKKPEVPVEKRRTRTQIQEKSPPKAYNLRGNSDEKTPPLTDSINMKNDLKAPAPVVEKVKKPIKKGLKVLNNNILSTPVPTRMETEDDDPESHKKDMENRVLEKKKSVRDLYKFRPNMAKLLKYNGWGTKKEIKKAISDYVKTKSLYRKDLDELDVTKDHELEEIMGLRRIPRKDIFEEFMHFMLRKSFEEVIYDNQENLFDDNLPHEKDNDDSLKVNKKNAVREVTKNLPSDDEEFGHLGPKIKRKSAAILKAREKQKENIPNPDHRPGTSEEKGEDFFNWQPKPMHEKRQQKISNNLENEEEPNISKKFKSNSLEKTDFAAFRTDLDWFMTPGITLSKLSINSESILKKLWLKEAETLF